MNSEENNLTCLICKEVYSEPILLPCGETVCKKCTSKILVRCQRINSPQFKCLLCNKHHDMPKSGFPINKLTTSMIKERPKNSIIYKRDNNVSILKRCLDQIKLENEKLRQSVLNPVVSVDDYCSNLEKQIKDATNRKIKQINELNDKLLSEINLFKKNCIKSFDRETRVIYEETNSNIDKFYEDWSSYLASSNRDENEILNGLSKARKLQFHLKKSQFDTENLIFNSKMLDFYENIKHVSNDTIGSLIYKNKTLSSFKELESIDLRKNFKEQHSICKNIKLTTLENGTYVAAYFSSSDSIRLVLIDRNFTTIKEKNETAHSAGFFINYFKLLSYKNTLVIYSWMSKSYMKIFDEHLNTKAYYPSFEGYFTSITFDDSNIICLDALKSTLYIYDWNIKLQLSLRTNNIDLNYYLPNNTIQIESFETKIFLKHKTYISIINQSDGKFIKSFNSIVSNKFLIDRIEKYIVIISDDLKKIVYYTFDGETIYENELLDFPDGLKYIIDYGGRIIFFEDIKAVMYK